MFLFGAGTDRQADKHTHSGALSEDIEEDRYVHRECEGELHEKD